MAQRLGQRRELKTGTDLISFPTFISLILACPGARWGQKELLTMLLIYQVMNVQAHADMVCQVKNFLRQAGLGTPRAMKS
jgi:hypothetical protein